MERYPKDFPCSYSDATSKRVDALCDIQIRGPPLHTAWMSTLIQSIVRWETLGFCGNTARRVVSIQNLDGCGQYYSLYKLSPNIPLSYLSLVSTYLQPPMRRRMIFEAFGINKKSETSAYFQLVYHAECPILSSDLPCSPSFYYVGTVFFLIFAESQKSLSSLSSPIWRFCSGGN